MSEFNYGQLLRDARVKAGKTLGFVAKLINKSLAYVSDIEHGARAALAADDTVVIAEALGVEPGPMLRASARERGKIEVRSDDPDLAQILVGLARSAEHLSKEDKDMLRQMAKKKVRDGA